MINIRRWLNEQYIYNNFDKKNIFYVSVILSLMVFFKIMTIIWWITLIILIWIFNKIYIIKKKHINEEEIDNYCKTNINDSRCKLYKNTKNNYNKLINNISKSL